jgi:hypothetical protein
VRRDVSRELAVLSRLHRDGPGSASRLANGERVTATVREQTVIDRMVEALESGYTTAERRQLAAAVPLLERLADLL